MNDEDIVRRLRPTQTITASGSFKERVMRAIDRVNESEKAASRVTPWWRGLAALKWATAGCAAAVLILLAPMLPSGGSGRQSDGATLLAQSVQAFQGIRSVHISGRIRTLPNDNFELIGAKYDFVPVELWRDYSQPPKWRVEKPGRVVVNDGASSLLFLRNTNTAMRAGGNAGFIEWLAPMLDPLSILESELLAARRGESEALVSEGGGKLVLTVRRAARGNFANDWARNKSFAESDHTCQYLFESGSKRLIGVLVRVGDVSVAEFDSFRYNEAMPAELFRLDLPADVAWMDAAPATEGVRLSGPRETARYFFDNLAAENWQSVAPLLRMTSVPDGVKRTYGRLQVLSVGEPFQSGLFPGYFVPYEVRLANGYVKNHKLAVRNDNPAGQWVVDGGY